MAIVLLGILVYVGLCGLFRVGMHWSRLFWFFRVSTEKLAVILVDFPLCVTWFFSCDFQYSLFCMLSVLIMIFCGGVSLFFCSCLLGGLYASCICMMYLSLICKFFCYDIAEEMICVIDLESLSLIYFYNSNVCSFHGVPHFLYAPFLCLQKLLIIFLDYFI